MVIKYKIEKTFRDKYSKQIVEENAVIDVTIERMKELNAKKFGRVIDIILDTEEIETSTDKVIEETTKEIMDTIIMLTETAK